MRWLFAMFYLVPAAASVLVFWALWRILRLCRMTVALRRALFVVLGTLLLTPVIVPAGTIMVAWVPHSVVMLMPDLQYYLHVANYIVPSFVITALLLAGWAWWRIRGELQPRSFDWTVVALPAAVAIVIVSGFNFLVPDRQISPHITVPAIEQVYGSLLDETEALRVIDDPAQQAGGITRLQQAFASHTPVVSVVLREPQSQGRPLFSYTRDRHPPSRSCSGTHRGKQQGLMRCTWSFGTFDKLETLQYVRPGREGDGSMVIEFVYRELLEQFGS